MADPIDLQLVIREDDFFDIDWTDDGDFVMSDTYETPIFMSVFCERRARPHEVPTPEYRRGWIGNLLYEDGDEDGSGVWLYNQSRLNLSTLNGVRDEVEKGLLWFVEEDIADSVAVTTQPVGGKIEVDIGMTSENSELVNTKITV